jgi:hypothetical protein
VLHTKSIDNTIVLLPLNSVCTPKVLLSITSAYYLIVILNKEKESHSVPSVI